MNGEEASPPCTVKKASTVDNWSWGALGKTYLRVIPREWQESWGIYPPTLSRHWLKAVPKGS